MSSAWGSTASWWQKNSNSQPQKFSVEFSTFCYNCTRMKSINLKKQTKKSLSIVCRDPNHNTADCWDTLAYSVNQDDGIDSLRVFLLSLGRTSSLQHHWELQMPRKHIVQRHILTQRGDLVFPTLAQSLPWISLWVSFCLLA